eukprot:scaffold165816_cov33-Tisochrysis_lutea.AAC.1
MSTPPQFDVPTALTFPQILSFGTELVVYKSRFHEACHSTGATPTDQCLSPHDSNHCKAIAYGCGKGDRPWLDRANCNCSDRLSYDAAIRSSTLAAQRRATLPPEKV